MSGGDAAANLGSLSVLIINLTYGAAVGVSAIEILSHRNSRFDEITVDIKSNWGFGVEAST